MYTVVFVNKKTLAVQKREPFLSQTSLLDELLPLYMLSDKVSKSGIKPLEKWVKDHLNLTMQLVQVEGVYSSMRTFNHAQISRTADLFKIVRAQIISFNRVRNWLDKNAHIDGTDLFRNLIEPETFMQIGRAHV